MAEAGERLAETGWPNEVCGLFYLTADGDCLLRALHARATPDCFDADPADLVAAVYEITDCGGRVVGTMHAHPSGPARFSRRDRLLLAWGSWHTLIVKRQTGWKWVFGRRETIAQHLPPEST